MSDFSQGSDDNSIIRSIMVEREEHDRVADPLMLVASAVNTLKEREREVLQSRYGLLDGDKKTLDAVGQDLGVTRERVRQIESAALKRLASKPTKELIHLMKVIHSHMVESGGVVSLDDLVAYFRLPADMRIEAEKNAIRLVMNMDEGVVALGKATALKTGWALKGFSQSILPTIIKTAEEELAKEGHPLSSDEIWTQFMGTTVYSAHADKITMNGFIGALKLADKIAETPDGMWGLTSWPTVMPKRIRDKVYVILENAKKPMHFKDIAEGINKKFGGKPVLARTVHNELIGDKRFVLVGRGIYALKSLGYKPGVVADVIKRVLEEAGAPLTTDEIVEKVLMTREVKRNTVIANLQNKEVFRKVGRGEYELVEEND